MNSKITHTAIQQRMAEGVPEGHSDETTVRRLWWAALDILQEKILVPIPTKGIWLASPLPALYEPKLLNQLEGWLWSPPELLSFESGQSTTLLPPGRSKSVESDCYTDCRIFRYLSLREEDGQDPLLIIITPEVQVALALQGDKNKRNLLMRSDPKTLSDILKMLDFRLNEEDPKQAKELRNSLASLGKLNNQDNLKDLFWPLLSERLASMAPSLTLQPILEHSEDSIASEFNSEVTLLEALTHEVRTPLATIRTLIRSLLRRNDLNDLVYNRLQQIDSECTEQIDRFGLIFNAAELHRQPVEASRLASTDLGSMLELLAPSWEQQLGRREVILQLDIAQDLPEVLSDSERLEPMLGGLIDQTSRALPPGGILFLQLRPAGHRLKLQILCQTSNRNPLKEDCSEERYSDLETVLSWDPNTGSLQVTQAATQRLLASLGGRLTHRRDSGITVFFPIVQGN